MKQQLLIQIKTNVECLKETKQTREYVVNKLQELMNDLDYEIGIHENRCAEHN